MPPQVPRSARARLPALLAILFLASLAPASAEEQGAPADPRPEIRRRFALGTPADVAWGAWLAAEHGLTAYRDEIEWRLRTARPNPDHSTWLAQGVLLDAAIRLHVSPGAIDLLPLVRAHPEAAVALATSGRRPPAAAMELLLALDNQGGGTHTAFVALGNRLRDYRTPGFVAWVLGQVPWQAKLHVFSTDDTSVGAPYPPPPTGSVTGCGVVRVPAEFPPIPRWHIEVRPRAAGDHAGPQLVVMVTRSVVTDREWGVGSSSYGRGPARLSVLCGWMHDAADRSAAAWALGYPQEWSLDWTGRQPWDRFLQPRIDAFHAAHWALVQDLADRGYLTADEARNATPVVRVFVIDHRRDTTRTLPPVPPARVKSPWPPSSSAPPAHRV